MMKMFKKVSSIVLSLLLVFSFQMFSIVAHAVGVGTEENPYWIETADQLQNINEDVTAHYVLKANIDLGNVDFTPIGNATSGAFSGSFDGNGFTISNLSVFSGKYAGLFGCNEGTIKNVKLSDIFVYGTRYVGGVVGHNTSLGTLENCKVLSGDVESDGGLNAVNVGGICGYNEGFFEKMFYNGAEITVDFTSNIGGIIGYNNTELFLTAENTAKVSSLVNSSYVGGLVGKSSSIIISNSKNGGEISGGEYVGGLVGYSTSSIVSDSKNSGEIAGSDYGYAGGLVGYSAQYLNINNCNNIANITGINTGGIVAHADVELIINDCYNTGDINTTYCSGGIVGSAYNVTTFSVTNCYNTGNLYSNSRARSGLGGIAGGLSLSKVGIIHNCFNSGNIAAPNGDKSWGDTYWNPTGGIIGYKSGGSYGVNLINVYNTGNIISYVSPGGISDYFSTSMGYNTGNVDATISATTSGCHGVSGNAYGNSDSYISSDAGYIADCLRTMNSSEMRVQINYVNWDFESTWIMSENVNSGYPLLRNVQSPLQLNIANKSLITGETMQLIAYKNGVSTNDVEWYVSYGNAIVNNSGLVTATSTGLVTITAKDDEGNKANCSIYVMSPNTSVNVSDFSVNQGQTISHSVTFGNTNSGDYIVSAKSSNSDILQIYSYGDSYIYCKGNAPGTAIVTFKTAQGFTGSCTATVTNYATGINISSSLSVNRGESKQIALSTSPNPSSSTVTWTSANPNIATVDQNGIVTGVKTGNVTITATTDNGHSDTCTVYVYAPVKSLAFTEESITLEQGQTYQTSIIKDPVDTTDSISYSSSTSSSSRLSVNSNGLITAGTSYTGTYTITATASSGVKAYLDVTVIEKRVNPTEINLNYNDKTMILGDDFDLIPTLSPSNSTADITYSSDDESVATVDENGNVKAVGEGTTIIRVNTSNGLSTSCVVTVYGFTKVNGVEYFDIYAIEDFIIFRDYVNKSTENTSTNARLMVDLDLSSVCGESLGSFTPIGSVNSPYNGVFDGNGHKIKNLYIDSTAYSGLFGYIGADCKVCNLVLDNVLVAGTNYVGGIAGKSEGVIEKTTVSGIVFGASYVGGIVGSNTGAINYCGNTAEVLGTSIVGGITGDSTSTGTISNCYSDCEITASDYRQGGLCGMNYGTISNSYYDNTLYTGSVVGRGNSDNCENSAKPSTAFASGEVTYLLNSDLENVVFYQTLGTDPYPILNSKHYQVYFGFENCNSGKEIYTNNIVSPERPNHNFVDDVCTICGVKNTTIAIREQSFIEGLIYGSHSVEWLESELENMEEIIADDIYIEVYDFEDLQLQNYHNIGTASKVYVYDSSTDELINLYTVVLYGDVNGDGIIDELDTDVIKGLALRTDEVEPAGNWKWFLMAADTNHDGAVDGFDVIETELQTLDMHVIEQKNTLAYLTKDEVEEETDTIQE